MQLAKVFVNKAGQKAKMTPALMKTVLITLMKEQAAKAGRNIPDEHMTHDHCGWQ